MNQLAPIRPAEIADLDALVSLSKRTIRARYTSFLGAKVVQDYLASGAVENFFKESLPRCFVVEEDGGVAGVGAYKGVMVDLMMIDAEHQGHGLGTRLLKHLETLLFEKSAEFTLESFEHNEPAEATVELAAYVALPERITTRRIKSITLTARYGRSGVPSRR